jgi:hypothetical protein
VKPIIKLPAEHYLQLIKDNKPFSLSRFGDGDALCMQLATHWLKENCDGSKFLPELIEPMKQIFRNQYPYYHCLLDCSFDLNGQHFRNFLEQTCPDMDFYDGEIWQHLSFSGRITELITAMAKHKPCFIGGEHIKRISSMKGLDEHAIMVIPNRDAFLSFHSIYDEIMRLHDDNGIRFFAFSAGYSTKPLIDTLFPYIGNDSFLIDFGSVFDPYCGVLSRDGMKFKGLAYFQQFTDYEL